MGIRARTYLSITFLALVGLAVPVGAGAHELDHPVPNTFTQPAPVSTTNFNAGGEGAKWEPQAFLPTGNPQSDLDFFTQKGETFASVGVLGTGANGGGQTIVQLTDKGETSRTSPKVVGSQPSAACPQLATGVTGLQHDVEATPKSNTILNTDFPGAVRTDAQLLLDASDAAGRCHDQAEAGLGAPRGGIEIIDITDVRNPQEIGLTSHIGESHTVNVDPRRPHIAYSVTSDSVGIRKNADGTLQRNNERDAALIDGGQPNNLDGFEIIDLRSCMTDPTGQNRDGFMRPGLTIEEKRGMCQPQVSRFRYPSIDIVLGHTNQASIFGCHETEVYPDDTMTCGSGSAAILFDIKGLFDDNGTPGDFTDDTVNGTPLDCQVRDSSSIGFTETGAKVTDCVNGGADGKKDLRIPAWLKDGAPSATGIKHVGSAFHQGRETTQQDAARPDYGADQDIDFNHETELTGSGKYLIATDERGGGVLTGAQCTPGDTTPSFANGGLSAYKVDRLQTSTPKGDVATDRANRAFEAYARNAKGEKSIFRTRIETEQPQGSFCTAHVMQQIPGQNRIFMGWYSQGTQVIDFTENPDGTFDFKRAGFFIPEAANQWVSSVYKMQKNEDGTFTYFGATGDGVISGTGRQGIDVYKVTLPAPQTAGSTEPPPKPGAGTNPTSAPNTPPTATPTAKPGVTPGTPPSTTAPPTACAATSGFSSAGASRRGRGATLAFSRRTQNPVTVDVFRQSVGRRVIGERLVARFSNRSSSVRWNGRANRGRRGALGDGYYFVRYRMSTSQGTDTRRVVLRRSNGRFSRQTDFFRRGSCDLLPRYKLERPVFGGTGRAASLGISYQLARAGRVTVTVLRGSRVVKRYPVRSVAARRLVRLRLSGKGLPRGQYRVRLSAREASGAAITSTLASQKL